MWMLGAIILVYFRSIRSLRATFAEESRGAAKKFDFTHIYMIENSGHT